MHASTPTECSLSAWHPAATERLRQPGHHSRLVRRILTILPVTSREDIIAASAEINPNEWLLSAQS